MSEEVDFTNMTADQILQYVCKNKCSTLGKDNMYCDKECEVNNNDGKYGCYKKCFDTEADANGNYPDCDQMCFGEDTNIEGMAEVDFSSMTGDQILQYVCKNKCSTSGKDDMYCNKECEVNNNDGKYGCYKKCFDTEADANGNYPDCDQMCFGEDTNIEGMAEVDSHVEKEPVPSEWDLMKKFKRETPPKKPQFDLENIGTDYSSLIDTFANNGNQNCDCSIMNTAYGSSMSVIVTIIWVLFIIGVIVVLIYLFSGSHTAAK